MGELINNSQNFDYICYKNSFLDRVIFRFDFLKPVLTEKIFSEQIIDKILEKYPAKGKRERFFVDEVKVNINNCQDKSNCVTEYCRNDSFFKQPFDDSCGNRVFLSNTYIVFEIKKYCKYESIRSSMDEILDEIFRENNDCIVGRVGVRYINIFSPKQIILRKKYFSNNVASVLVLNNVSRIGQFELIRSLRREEYKFESMSLNFIYGMYNQYYPRKIEQADFVMDFDCFLQGYLVEKSEIMNIVDKGHNAIQCLFEHSITDNLREKMNE